MEVDGLPENIALPSIHEVRSDRIVTSIKLDLGRVFENSPSPPLHETHGNGLLDPKNKLSRTFKAYWFRILYKNYPTNDFQF